MAFFALFLYLYYYIYIYIFIYPQTRVLSFPGLISVARDNVIYIYIYIYIYINEDKCHLLAAGHRYETLWANIYLD